MIGDDVYHVPFDIGFSTLAYRADKIPIAAEDESWNILLDPAYKQKISIFSDDVTIIKIGALINAGEPIDPNVLDTEQIEAAKETMIKAKPQIRNFWDSSTDAVNDFVNGNVWATYAWPDGYYKIKNHPKMKDVDDSVHVAEGGPAGLGLRLRAEQEQRAPGPRARGRRSRQHADGRRLADRRLPVRRGSAGRRDQT